MTLPTLPRQIKQKEASFGVLFRAWIIKHPRYSCTLELKQTKTDSIPFSAVEPAQVAWALQISGPKGALVRVQGLTGEPDYIWCCNMPAYVVIRYPRSFHLISIGTWLMERDGSKRKSLTEVRAFEISTVSVKQ